MAIAVSLDLRGHLPSLYYHLTHNQELIAANFRWNDRFVPDSLRQPDFRE
jgi:hypothetical protein